MTRGNPHLEAQIDTLGLTERSASQIYSVLGEGQTDLEEVQISLEQVAEGSLLACYLGLWIAKTWISNDKPRWRIQQLSYGVSGRQSPFLAEEGC